MQTSKIIITIFAVFCGLVALFMFANQDTQGRTLLNKYRFEDIDSEPWVQFQNFMQKYNKTYSSMDEMKERYNIFYQNYFWIKVQNTKSMNMKHGINHFTDLTQDEFKKQYLHYKFDPDLEVEYAPDENIMVAESVDWVSKGAVTGVKDQGQCGSCWAFSSVGSLEGAYFQKTGQLKQFSESQLVDCSGSYGNQGCNGGLMNNAFKYWQDNAFELESDYPYEAVTGTCKADSSKGVAKLSSYKSVWSSESSLKSALNGRVISVAVDASHWSTYESGIYDGECSGWTLDHGVTLVGYGTDDDGQDYWRIKNSWTTSWGEEGFIRLKRTDSIIGWGQCGVARQASYPVL